VLFGVGPYMAAWAVAHSGTRPPDRALQDTPADYGLAYEEIVFPARDSVRLSGWFIAPTGRNAVVICTHGLFRNRVELLQRTVSLVRAGYGALLYDSRSHGESEKASVSLGYHEKNDVLGAEDYVTRRFQDSTEQPAIVLLGVSVGAAATLEAAAESKVYSALILDSPFSSVRETVVRHSWLLLKMPRYPFPSLFLFWLGRITGAEPDEIDLAAALNQAEPAALLVIASEGDKRMGTDAARALYAQSRARVKKIQIFGADVPHGAAARLHPQTYSACLLEFLDQALPRHHEPEPRTSN
jgi:pimeloyl-ACP methyl ester carboxylesterase